MKTYNRKMENIKVMEDKHEMTVEDLIKLLKKFDKKLPVKYTLGGSSNYGKIDYVDGHYSGEFVLIGKCTW